MDRAITMSEPNLTRSIRKTAAVRLAGSREPLAGKVRICRSLASRFLGLMLRLRLTEQEGALLVFDRATRWDSSIHMLFVFFPLGVFWLDDSGTVVDAVHARPWRPFYISSQPSRYVLELHASRLQSLRIGDTLEFNETDLRA